MTTIEKLKSVLNAYCTVSRFEWTKTIMDKPKDDISISIGKRTSKPSSVIGFNPTDRIYEIYLTVLRRSNDYWDNVIDTADNEGEKLSDYLQSEFGNLTDCQIKTYPTNVGGSDCVVSVVTVTIKD